MRTYQARFSLGQDADGSLREYAAVFSHALRSLHASRHAGTALRKPAFMREFGLTSRQYNAVRFSLSASNARQARCLLSVIRHCSAAKAVRYSCRWSSVKFRRVTSTPTRVRA